MYFSKLLLLKSICSDSDACYLKFLGIFMKFLNMQISLWLFFGSSALPSAMKLLTDHCDFNLYYPALPLHFHNLFFVKHCHIPIDIFVHAYLSFIHCAAHIHETWMLRSLEMIFDIRFRVQESKSDSHCLCLSHEQG